MNHLLCRACLASALLLASTVALRAGLSEEDEMAAKVTAAQFPIDQVPVPLRPKVEALLRQPTAYCRGPIEAFPCQPPVYAWLLDHPHLGFRAWKALGVKCATVEQKEDGSFHGVDPLGSELRWHEVLREPHRRVWYAEGQAKPAPLTPSVPIKVLLLLRHHEVVGADGRIGVRHRAELFAQFDTSKASKLISRLWGLTTETAAKKAAEQVELFFSGLAWYMTEHPDWVQTTFAPTRKTTALEAQQVDALLRLLASLPPPTPSPPGSLRRE
jgi:hypothetical protein